MYIETEMRQLSLLNPQLRPKLPDRMSLSVSEEDKCAYVQTRRKKAKKEEHIVSAYGDEWSKDD